MKKIFLLVCLLLRFFFAPAQSWQPIHLGWKYNYTLGADSLVTATIFADSTEIVSGDSVFYLNRIVSHCDTCHATLGGSNPCDSCYELVNQPQFLQRKMKKMAGGIFYFSDTSKLVFPTQVSLNTVFVFDSLSGITAQLISIHQEAVFGTLDSIKTFLLSNSDTVKLSMNNGLLLFPDLRTQNYYYRLVGIEGPSRGEQVPDFWDFFDFDVGDVFHYEGYHATAFGGGPVFSQSTVTSSFISGDTIFYTYQRILGGAIAPYDSYLNSLDNVTNFHSNQLVSFANWTQGFVTDGFDKMYFEKDTDGIYKKNFGSNNILQPSSNFIPLNANYPIMNVTGNYPLLEESYKVGLGLVHLKYAIFEGFADDYLVGYIKNGVTYGNVLTGIPDNYDAEKFWIFPSPAHEMVKITFSDFTSGKILVFDAVGKMMLEENFSCISKMLDISALSPGVYILQIQTAKGNMYKKIIISE